MTVGTAVLLGFLLLGTSIWIGGIVTILVVSRVATATLDTAQRIAFFRRLGQSHGMVGGLALLVALGTGAALVWGRSWDTLLIAAVAVAAAVVAATAVGVVQARRMSRLRQSLLDRTGGRHPGGRHPGGQYRDVDHPDGTSEETRLRRGAGRATALRTLIGLLSLALLTLGVALAA